MLLRPPELSLFAAHIMGIVRSFAMDSVNVAAIG
jgi:hypothetical protein